MKVSLESEKIRLGEERTHLASLDGIRGLTALMLIVLHYATAAWSFDPPYIPLPFPYPMDELTQFMYRGVWGGVGVATFFLLSGFTFMWNYQEKISRHSISFRTFAVYRFSRLYPLCWLTSVIMLIISIVDKEWAGGMICDAYGVLKSFTVLGTFVLDAGTPTLNGVTWTLSLEIAMYGLFYLITWNSNRVKEKVVLYILPILLGVTFLNLGATNLPIVNQYFATALVGFFMGCITCEIYKIFCRSHHKNVIGYGCLACIVLFVFSWFSFGIEYYSRTYASLNVTYSIVVIPLFVFAVLFVKPLQMVLSSRILTLIGKFSFSIYLLHYVILTIISLANKCGIIEFNASDPLNLLWVVGITVIISAISYTCFERPIQIWIRKKYHAYIGSGLKS